MANPSGTYIATGTLGSNSSVDAHFYLGDHLGTGQMEFASGGWPVWQGQFAPYGQELDTQTTANNYKFTGKERDAESGLDYFDARYYGSSMGRFTSPDPFNIITRAKDRDQFDMFLGQPQNWKMYAYTWNNPLRYTDPTGETVYVVTYTQGNEEGDEDFKKAALTRANNIKNTKGYDPTKDTVLVAGVSSFKDFAKVISQANGLAQQFWKVGEVDLFSHSGLDGPNFNEGMNKPGGPHHTNEQNPQGLASLSVNWAPGAFAGFYGCKSAGDMYDWSSRDFAQMFANKQGVITEGFHGYSSFSSNASGWSKRFMFGGVNEYMVHRAGSTPPVRRTPQE